jgi:hypothetical protein
MTHKPNLIKVAITAAGGRETVAREFGITAWGVGNWTKTAGIPANRIRRLCELGDNIVSAEQLLAYIEQAKAERAEQVAA